MRAFGNRPFVISLASAVLSRGADAARMARAGAALGLPAFAAVLVASGTQSVALFELRRIEKLFAASHGLAPDANQPHIAHVLHKIRRGLDDSA